MITKWGVQLPEMRDLPAKPVGIVLHWTAGTGKANLVDLAAYHYVVNADGTVRQGTHSVGDNMRKVSGEHYARHTGGFNSYRIGLSAAGMKGYQGPENVGRYPLKEVQIKRLCELAGYFCEMAGLDPLNPSHLCTHREVWTIHLVKGTTNHTKRDIEHLPFRPELEPDEVGPHLRAVTAMLLARPLPDDAVLEPIVPRIVPKLSVPDRRPPALNLDQITVPKREHVAEIVRVRGLKREDVDKGLRVAERLMRGVAAGREGAVRVVAKGAADALADYINDRS